MKRYVKRIAIYRCGCDEKFREDYGSGTGYIWTVWHNGPRGIKERRCPGHKEPLVILSESGYFKTAEYAIVSGNIPLFRNMSAYLDDEFTMEFK